MRRRALRLNVDARTEAMTGDDVRRDADDRAVDGREHVRTGRGADVERGRRAAVELVPEWMAAGASEHRVEHALHDAFVALLTDRRECHRTVIGGVVADRRRAPLRDRHLQPNGAANGDDLRIRLCLRRRPDVGDGDALDALRRPTAECGQQQCDHENDRQQGEEREAAGTTRCAHLPTFDAPPPVGA